MKQVHVVTDGQEVFNDYGLAFVGNISRYAVGLRICRDARFDDGLLDMVVFSCQKQTNLVLHAAWTLLRRHPLKGNVLYRPAREIRIETDTPLPCEVDGDLGPSTPLEVSIAPYTIKLLVPPERKSWGLWSAWPWKGEAPV